MGYSASTTITSAKIRHKAAGSLICHHKALPIIKTLFVVLSNQAQFPRCAPSSFQTKRNISLECRLYGLIMRWWCFPPNNRRVRKSRKHKPQKLRAILRKCTIFRELRCLREATLRSVFSGAIRVTDVAANDTHHGDVWWLSDATYEIIYAYYARTDNGHRCDSACPEAQSVSVEGDRDRSL